MGQKNQYPFISEFAISSNRTFNQYIDKPWENKGKYGLGFGVYHCFYPSHRINLVTGFEINQIRRWLGQLNVRHFYIEKNTTLSKTSLSVPFGIRINLGRKHQYVFMTGAFYNEFLYGRGKGIASSSIPDEHGIPVHKETSFNRGLELNRTLGFYAGIGLKVTISNSAFLIQPEIRKVTFYNMYNDGDEDLLNYFRLNVSYGFSSNHE